MAKQMVSFLAADEDLKNLQTLQKLLRTGQRGKSNAIREALRMAVKLKTGEPDGREKVA